MPSMSSALEEIREAAVQRGICPVSLEDLRSKPDQVGALVHRGHRVEAALYHRDSVLLHDGRLRCSDGLSPITRVPVDAFVFMPSVPSTEASMEEWEDFANFFHWDKGQGDWLLVGEVAIAFTAIYPVDEDGAERFIRSHFDVDCDGHIQRKELEEQVLPYLSHNLEELQNAHPHIQMPELWRGASRADSQRWFDFWDRDKMGELDRHDFQFAVARTLYRALGAEVSSDTKEAVVVLFLSEVNVEDAHHITRTQFLDVIAPALLANLPEPPNALNGGKDYVIDNGSQGEVLKVQS